MEYNKILFDSKEMLCDLFFRLMDGMECWFIQTTSSFRNEWKITISISYQTDFDWLQHLITLTLITSFNKTPLFNNSLIIHSFVHSINIIPTDLWSYQLFFVVVLHYLSQAQKTYLNTTYNCIEIIVDIRLWQNKCLYWHALFKCYPKEIDYF